jgi:hypothetical protein
MIKTKCTKKQLEALARGREKRAKNIRLNNRLKNQLGGRPDKVNYMLVKDNLEKVGHAAGRAREAAQRLAIYAIATAICKQWPVGKLYEASRGQHQFRQLNPKWSSRTDQESTSVTYRNLAQAYFDGQEVRFANVLNSACNFR